MFQRVEKLLNNKTKDQKINEAIKVAEYFQLQNDTQWNFYDDEFYIMNRRWFEKWKQFVSYDYIVNHVMTLKRSVKDLSINKIISGSG